VAAWSGAAGICGGIARLGGAGRKEMKLMDRARTSAREERERIEDERHKLKRKTYFERTPMEHRPDGLAERGGGRRARQARWVRSQ
jgi:hypothetical protein